MIDLIFRRLWINALILSPVAIWMIGTEIGVRLVLR